MPTTYEWYELVEATDPLEQGDFLHACPAFIIDYAAFPWERLPPPGTRLDIPVHVGLNNVIVLTQSCDLVNNPVENVVICPHFSLEEMYDSGLKRGSVPNILKGYMPTYHMLEECTLEERVRGIRIVDFGQAYSLPFDSLTKFAHSQGQRRRLKPPYREHLSQAYARYFMRVGLPQSISLPKEEKK